MRRLCNEILFRRTIDHVHPEFFRLDRELREKYRTKSVAFKELWDFRPACVIDDEGNQVELSDEEKTVELFTEGEISSGNIACYVIEDRF